jgi:predicted PurR-regulated permease PerM
MNSLKKNWNLVIIGYILFFGCIICYSFLSNNSFSSIMENMSTSLSDAANADSLKTDMLSAKVDALQPIVDKVSANVGDNAASIKTNMDTITSILKEKVNNVNKKVGKDITDKNNAPPPVTGLS